MKVVRADGGGRVTEEQITFGGEEGDRITATLNKKEKKALRLQSGTFFKLVVMHRVSARSVLQKSKLKLKLKLNFFFLLRF